MKFVLQSIVFCGLVSQFICSNILVCYYGTWATYRPGNGAFNVENIDPNLCTHIIYAFFGINQDGSIRILDAYLDLEENWGRGNINKFIALKQKNPKLKLLAGVGGWNEGSLSFSMVARDANRRLNFAKSSLEFCLKYGFDGVDFDWEYPGQRDGRADIDKENFVLLLKDVRKLFDKTKLILTAAVASAEFSAKVSYNIPQIARYLDMINIMTYDLHGPWDMRIGNNAPLYEGLMDVTPLQRQLNINASVNYWLKEGAPREKLILGIPLYGRTYTLRNPSTTDVGSYHSGPGIGGPYTSEPGMIGYNEFCEKQLTNHWSRQWDTHQKVPYAYSNAQWISYDDIESVSIKAKFILDLNLGGAMVWSIETDDFRGLCGQNRYPLLNTIKRALGEDETESEIGTGPPITSTTPTTSKTPTTTTTITAAATASTPTTVTSSTPSSNFACKVDGIFRDPLDCAAFYICENGHLFTFKCPTPLLFDNILHVCNWPNAVEC